MTKPSRLLALTLALAGCDGGAAPTSAPQARDLDADAVAQVADERIDAATVRAIARAQGVSLEVARDRAIRDALFAVEARARGRAPRAAESSLLARKLIEERRRELDGPVTDAELAAAKERHWFDLDRPAGARVVHVVVLTKAPGSKRAPDEATWAKAEAVAKRIAQVATSAGDKARAAPTDDAGVVAELGRVVATVDAEGLETKTESLPSVAADGRVLAPGGGRFAPEFATAVAALRERGELTPPFRSPFGVHVAILLERTAAVTLPDDEVRDRVRDEVIEGRLAKTRREITDALGSTVEIATNAAALLDLVHVAGPQQDGVAQDEAGARP